MDKKKKTKPKEINVDEIDLDLMKERTTDLPGLIEYAHNVGGFSIAPTKQGVIKGSAMKAMQEQTDLQMGQIYEQMQLLAKQAAKLKERAEVSSEIYNAEIRFKPVIGKTYFLYEKKDKKKILSMIAPEEWSDQSPFEKLIARVKLLADHTWEVIDQ